MKPLYAAELVMLTICSGCDSGPPYEEALVRLNEEIKLLESLHLARAALTSERDEKIQEVENEREPLTKRYDSEMPKKRVAQTYLERTIHPEKRKVIEDEMEQIKSQHYLDLVHIDDRVEQVTHEFQTRIDLLDSEIAKQQTAIAEAKAVRDGLK